MSPEAFGFLLIAFGLASLVAGISEHRENLERRKALRKKEPDGEFAWR